MPRDPNIAAVAAGCSADASTSAGTARAVGRRSIVVGIGVVDHDDVDLRRRWRAACCSGIALALILGPGLGLAFGLPFAFRLARALAIALART